MSPSRQPRTPQAAYWRRVDRFYPFNARLHIIQGILALFAMGLFSPGTVLTPYVKSLTHSKFLIGLPWALSMFFWSFTSLFYSYFLRYRRSRKDLVITLGVFARTGFALMAVSCLVAVLYGPFPALLVFFFAETVLALFAGGAAISWQDLIGRVIPPEKRSWFFGIREALGQLAALAAALWLFFHFSGKSGLPADYLLPLAGGALVYWVSWALFTFTREPRWPIDPPTRPPWRDFLRDTFSILRTNPNFRLFVTLRCLTAAVGIFNLGLFAPYAMDHFGVSAAVVAGVFTALFQAGRIVSALVTGKLAQRFGYKAALILGLATLAATLAVGLSLDYLGPLALPAFFAIYFLIGAQGTAVWMAIFNLQLEFGPVQERPRYIALGDSLSAPVTLAAGALSGLLIDATGYRPVMLAALVVALAVLALAARFLKEPPRIDPQSD